MPFSEKEMLEDLRKVHIRKYVYSLGGLGILGLSAALVAVFFSRRDLPALMLAGAGAFWCGVLLYQARRTSELGRVVKARLEESETSAAGGDSGRAPGDGAGATAAPADGTNATAAGTSAPGDGTGAEGGGAG